MPFELVNALATFQRHITTVLQPVLGEGVLIYLNDILLAQETKKEHMKKVKKVQ